MENSEFLYKSSDGDIAELHSKGEYCVSCPSGFPKPHECGGMIHACGYDKHYEDAELDFAIWGTYQERCDKCGMTR